MLVKLTRPARIRHEAGETVNVSPADFCHLTSIGSAVPVSAATAQEKEPQKKGKSKK